MSTGAGQQPERQHELEPERQHQPAPEAEAEAEAEPVTEAEPAAEAQPVTEAEPVTEAQPATEAQRARPRSRHRRVVALSDVDRRRLEAGEIADPVDALHTGDAGAVEVSDEPDRGTGPNDARLLRDVPPHWGRR